MICHHYHHHHHHHPHGKRRHVSTNVICLEVRAAPSCFTCSTHTIASWLLAKSINGNQQHNNIVGEGVVVVVVAVVIDDLVVVVVVDDDIDSGSVGGVVGGLRQGKVGQEAVACIFPPKVLHLLHQSASSK